MVASRNRVISGGDVTFPSALEVDRVIILDRGLEGRSGRKAPINSAARGAEIELVAVVSNRSAVAECSGQGRSKSSPSIQFSGLTFEITAVVAELVYIRLSIRVTLPKDTPARPKGTGSSSALCSTQLCDGAFHVLAIQSNLTAASSLSHPSLHFLSATTPRFRSPCSHPQPESSRLSLQIARAFLLDPGTGRQIRHPRCEYNLSSRPKPNNWRQQTPLPSPPLPRCRAREPGSAGPSCVCDIALSNAL